MGRGLGYGMTSLRVDGNDALAVYASIKKAREFIIQNKQPVFIEFISYRVLSYYFLIFFNLKQY